VICAVCERGDCHDLGVAFLYITLLLFSIPLLSPRDFETDLRVLFVVSHLRDLERWGHKAEVGLTLQLWVSERKISVNGIVTQEEE